MPAYNNSPFRAAIRLLYAGVAEYLFGSWRQDVSPTQMYVGSVALATNVATVGVTIYGGDIPAVGSLISIRGTQNDVGAFNVTNVPLTAVAIGANGTGTVSFALVGADFGIAGDVGVAVVPQPVVKEAIVAGASVPVAMSNNSYGGDLDRTVTAQAIFGTLPTAVTIKLQASMVDDDASYVDVGTIATVAASAVTANGVTVIANWLFYRANVSGLTGNGTVAVLIEA